MGEITKQDLAAYQNAAALFQAEASKNALKAFSEGYLMGIRYAEMVLEKGADENKGN